MVVKYLFFLLLSMVLPINHNYRKRREDFFVGKVERDVAPLLPLVEELYDMV